MSTAPRTAAFLRSPHTQCSFRPERWHSFAHYINSRLCLHPGLSGLVAGGWNRIQLMWQEERKSKREEKREREEAKGVARRRCGRSGSKGQFAGEGGGMWCGQGWVLGVIIPITCSAVSCSVDGCGLSTHSTLNPVPFLMLWFTLPSLLRNHHNMPMQTPHTPWVLSRTPTALFTQTYKFESGRCARCVFFTSVSDVISAQRVKLRHNQLFILHRILVQMGQRRMKDKHS